MRSAPTIVAGVARAQVTVAAIPTGIATGALRNNITQGTASEPAAVLAAEPISEPETPTVTAVVAITRASSIRVATDASTPAPTAPALPQTSEPDAVSAPAGTAASAPVSAQTSDVPTADVGPSDSVPDSSTTDVGTSAPAVVAAPDAGTPVSSTSSTATTTAGPTTPAGATTTADAGSADATTATVPTVPTTASPAIPASSWTYSSDGAALSHDISVQVDGTDLVIVDNGVTSRRPLDSVTGLSVVRVGASVVSLTLNTSAGPISVPVSFLGGSAAALSIIGDQLDWTAGVGASGSVTGASLDGVTYSGVDTITADGSDNSLHGPQTDATWNVTGANSGTVAGQRFAGFSNLVGAADNTDTLVVSHGGSVSGILDGGPGGFDTLVLNGVGGAVTSVPSGAHSGTITFEGHILHYVGLEPITVTGASDLVVTGTTANDTLEVGADPEQVGYLRVRSLLNLMEAVSFQVPTGSLKIIDTASGVTIIIVGNLILAGVDLEIDAPTIVVNPGVMIDTRSAGDDGSVAFTAADNQTRSTAASASITVDGATIHSGSIGLEATANQTVNGSPVIGINAVAATAAATVAIIGDSLLDATGNVTLRSTSTTQATIDSTGTGADASVDAAVATADIDSSATTRVSDTSSVSAGGVLFVLAKNAATVNTTGNASAATAGAGIAVAHVTTNTAAYIDSHSSRGVSADSIVVSADADNTVVTTATSSPGGSTSNDAAPSTTTGGRADAPGGTIGIAGALAYTNLTQNTSAYIDPVAGTLLIAVSGASGPVAGSAPILVHAGGAGSAASVADGSAVGGTAAGVGTALAVNIATVDTRAYLGNITAQAPAIAVEALTQPTTAGASNTFAATSTSGAGGSALVGVTGSLALNVVTMGTSAAIAGTEPVVVGGANIALTAGSNNSNAVQALPGSTAGTTVGIGATVGLNIVNDTTTAGLGDGASLTGAHDVSLIAKAVAPTTTQAHGGALSPDIAIAPVIAITTSNVLTAARLGTGTPLVITGSLTATADQVASVQTTSSGEVDAAGAAVGLALAQTYATHTVEASTHRDVTAANNVAISATGASSTLTTATASATGAPGDGGQATPAAQIDSARAFADGAAPTAGGALPDGSGGTGPKPTPSAPSTPAGVMTVAAALALNVHTASADASVNGVVITAQGVSLDATLNESATSTASGEPSTRGPPSDATIAAAIAITVAGASARADIGPLTTVNATTLTLTAGVTPSNAAGDLDSTNRFTSTATAGPGSGGSLGLAGSVAIQTITLNTSASLLADAGHAPTVTLTGGAADFSATASSKIVTATRALMADGGSGTPAVGIGASSAVGIVDDTTVASIGDGAVVTGARNILISATSNDALTSEARTGAAAASVAVAPFAAVAVSTVATSARIGTGAILAVSGSVTDSASQLASASSVAGGSITSGTTAGIGAGLALTVADHSVSASTARSVTAVNNVTISASGLSSSAATSTASAAGGPENTASSGSGGGGGAAGSGVDDQIAAARGNADAIAAANGAAGSGSTAAPSASTSDGRVNVAAAVAVVVTTATARAGIEGAGVTVTTGGSVTIASSAHTDAASVANGSGSQGSTATIGAAVAITLANVTNEAVLPAGSQVRATALTVAATVTPNGMDAVSTYGAQATSGAGGGKISVAGSLGLAVINQTTAAHVAGTVALTGGDLTVTAASNVNSMVSADPTAGGVAMTGVGVGASVALNLVTDNTVASIDDGGAVAGAANITLSATAADSSTTEAKMGAAGGKVDIAPAVAVTLSNVTTVVRVGTGVSVLPVRSPRRRRRSQAPCRQPELS